MITKKFKGIWFYGLSGSGKTIASLFIKNHIKHSILVDGDKVRKYISTDLSYSLKDRKIQVGRVIGLVKLAKDSKIFPIVSTVYMNGLLMRRIKKEKIFPIKIERNFERIKNREKIYNKKIKNVIGIDINFPKIKNEFIIENNSTIKNLYKKLKKEIL